VIGVGSNEEIGKKTQIHLVLADQKELEEHAVLQNKVDSLEQKNNALETEMQRKESIDESQAAQEAAAKQREIEAKENKSFFDGNPNFRLAASLGVNTTLVDVQRNYLAGGAEIAWINTQSYVRPEVGIKGSTSIGEVKISGDDINRVSNVYGFVGVGGKALGMVGGIRVLGGQEWINIADNVKEQNQLAFGGEARLGYEWNRGVSTFVSYARTEHLQMIGLDVGISL
jgi:hypothetical protein